MNTIKEYTEYFTTLTKALKMDFTDTDMDNYVKNAIKSGLQQFWGAKSWSFKVATTTISITSAADSYDLPDDFDSAVSIKEKNSIRGFKLIHMNKEQFDELIPKPAVWDSDFPLVYTIYHVDSDDDAGKFVISIYPRPSSLTLDLAYNKTTNDNVKVVPDKFQSGVEACIASHIFLPGFNQRTVAYNEARAEIRRLEVQDNLDRSNLVKHLIEDSTPPRYNLRWWNF